MYFACLCRYLLDTDEVTRRKQVELIDKSLLPKWSEQRLPFWIKIQSWQYVIECNLYSYSQLACIKFTIIRLYLFIFT